MVYQSVSIMSAYMENHVASILKSIITTYYCLKTLQFDRRIIVLIPTTYHWLTSTLYSLAISYYLVGVISILEVWFCIQKVELCIFHYHECCLLVYVVDSWSSSNDPLEALLILMVVGLINISGILSPSTKVGICRILERFVLLATILLHLLL